MHPGQFDDETEIVVGAAVVEDELLEIPEWWVWWNEPFRDSDNSRNPSQGS
jgi:hypothetical protein